MEIKSWTTRLNLLTGKTVYKFPKTSLIQSCYYFLKFSKYAYKESWFKWIAKEGLDWLKWWSRGLIANYREYRLWSETMSPMLVKTRFSIFWILNIQEQWAELKNTNWWAIYLELQRVANNAWFELDDAHTLSNDDNWVIDNNWTVKLVDYGSKDIKELVSENSDAITNVLRKISVILILNNISDLPIELWDLVSNYFEAEFDYKAKDDIYNRILAILSRDEMYTLIKDHNIQIP